MTRTAIYKGYYFGVMAIVAAIALLVAASFGFSPISIACVFLALLIPGRILGFFWRDLLRGLRLLNAGQFAKSKRHSELFLSEVRKKSWIKHFIWLGSSTYSRDPEVLALNNLGAAEIKLGEFELARIHLAQAIKMDGQCALPFFNMGLLHNALDQSEEAGRCFQEAARLGYANNLSDRIVRASQARFANIDRAGGS